MKTRIESNKRRKESNEKKERIRGKEEQNPAKRRKSPAKRRTELSENGNSPHYCVGMCWSFGFGHLPLLLLH